MKIRINPDFRQLIPPQTPEEHAALEQSLLAEGCRDALVVWRRGSERILVDGHNRFDVCTKHSIPFRVHAKKFRDADEARLWILGTQMARRNLTPYTYGELELRKRAILQAGARERQRQGGRVKVRSTLTEDAEQRRTRTKLAKAAGVSTGTMHKIQVIAKHADETTKERLRRGETTINKAYTGILRERCRRQKVAELESIRSKRVKQALGVYDVLVIDPPWPMRKSESDRSPYQVAFDYPTMAARDILKIKLPCAKDCHVWLWATQRFLPLALRCIETWGLRYVCTFVWHKSGGCQPFGLPQFNCEFALYARKGSPSFIDTKAFFTCFEAPRGEHSEKPREFYDMVRRVTAGRRLDMFSRREIVGFDGHGLEAGKSRGPATRRT